MIEGEGMFAISELWQLPLRKKMAEVAMEKTLLGVADEVKRVKKEAQLVFSEVQYHEYLGKEMRRLLKVSREMDEEVKRRKEWGYVKEDEVYEVGIMGEEVGLKVDEEAMMKMVAMEELGEVMGVEVDGLRVAPVEVGHEGEGIEISGAVEAALMNRLDIRSAQYWVCEKERLLKLSRYRVFKDVHAGVSFERELDGKKLLGPALELEVPVFDQNQAEIAKREYEVRQARKELYALENRVRREVASSVLKVEYLRKKAEAIKMRILPLQERTVGFVEEWNGVMQINRFKLLEAQKRFIEYEIEYVRACKELRAEEIRLEYFVGGKVG